MLIVTPRPSCFPIHLFSEENRTVFSTEIKEVTEQALEMSAQGIIASLEGMKVRPERKNILSRASLPVLIIIGKQDPALDYNSLTDQAKYKNVTPIIFEDGHMSHIENELDLAAAFLNWFSNNVPQLNRFVSKIDKALI